MKLRRAKITNFKRFAPPGIEIDFSNQKLEAISDRFLILGDNGSGKTTVLQAIALTLGLACRRVPTVRDFLWKGWLPDRFYAHDNPRVELEIELSEDEISATQEAASRWWGLTRQSGTFMQPGASRVVTIALEGERVEARGGLAELRQLQGRSYAASAFKVAPDPRLYALFSRLPGVFWYDQYRTVATSGREEPDGRGVAGGAAVDAGFAVGVERLDRTLKAWHELRREQSLPPDRDYLAALERRFSSIFVGRRFAGLEPVYGASPTPDSTRFMLSDGSRTYALAEMSAGEQAIFPILFEFVRQSIHRSIVLIDELDLNLHPPLAQTLLGSLPRLGGDNQFIFTTHSSSVSNLVSPHEIHRLGGASLCL